MRLRLGDDRPRTRVTTRAAQDPRRQRRDARDRVGPGEQTADGAEVLAARGGPQPLAPDPERRSFVAEQRPETARTPPSTATVTTDDDRARTREDEQTGPIVQGTKQRGLGIGQDVDAPRKPSQPARQRATLAGRPDAARRDDERPDVTPRPPAAFPDRVEKLLQIWRSRRARREPRDRAPIPCRAHAQSRSSDVGSYAQQRSDVSNRGHGCLVVIIDAHAGFAVSDEFSRG